MIQAQIDEFIKYCSKVYFQNPKLPVNSNTIYSFLEDYNVSELEKRELCLEEIKNLKNNFYNSTNLDVFVDNSQPRFLQFMSKNYEPSKCVKLNVSVPKENLVEVSTIIFNYIDSKNYPCFSKVSNIVTSNQIIIRLSNEDDVKDVINFINSNDLITSVSREPNPFLIKNGVVGITYDDVCNYNTIVSEVLYRYFSYLKENNLLEQASFDDFYSFLKKEYDDMFINCTRITDLNNSLYFSDKINIYEEYGFVINNFEQEYRLLLDICNGKINKNNFYDFYNNSKDEEKNKGYYTYYDMTYERKNNPLNRSKEEEKTTFTIYDSTYLLNQYIEYAANKYRNLNTVINALSLYVENIDGAITKEYRPKFDKMLPPNLVRMITSNNIAGYVYKTFKKQDNVYEAFCDASKATYLKYGREQLGFAIDNALVGNFDCFTNQEYRNRLKAFLKPELIEKYCLFHLQSKGYNEQDLLNKNVIDLFIDNIVNECEKIKQKDLTQS